MLNKIYVDYVEAEENQEEMLAIDKKCDLYNLCDCFKPEEMALIEETITNYCQEYFKLGFKNGVKLIRECEK